MPEFENGSFVPLGLQAIVVITDTLENHSEYA